MEKKYNHQKVESEQVDQFLSESSKLLPGISFSPSFTCLLPPPNITGKLHLGHMWNCTIQDILIRFNYLQGNNVNWLIGLDHAGIATQIKLEKHLTAQITKFNSNNYSLDWLKEKGQGWFKKHKELIINQWKKMGLLMNFGQVAYTLDPEFNKLVVQAFVKLYNDGLISKGKKMINWDVKLQTAISDLEVIHKTEKSKLYHLKYYLVENPSEYLVVATSRPETIFADACLFVNPQDSRYTKYIGKEVTNPLNQKKMTVLTDESVLINFGTGVLKCTPAHDFHDYELGIKYNLPCEVCLDSRGYLNELAGKYQGLERFNGRKKIINDLQAENICFKIENYETNIGYSQRSNVIIEPYLSSQWFLNYRRWIEKIEEKKGKKFKELLNKIEFLPPEYNYRLFQWKTNLKEWCLSRQLWWGHQIPAWYHKNTGELYVAESPPKDIENWKQEKMVLDTWFSSGLIPVFYSNLGKEKIELPITLLATAYDILFFWVFKMLCFSYYFTEKQPFNYIMIHGLIRDSQGNKMSKSLGNVINPEELIEKYGADATRLTFVSSQTQDQDLKIQENKLKGNWRFLDKIWNIARFLEKVKDENQIENAELIEFAENYLSSSLELKYLEKDYLNCYFLFIFRNFINFYSQSLNKLEVGKAVNQLKKLIICESDNEEARKLAKLGIETSGKREDFGNDYLEIFKLSENKNSLKVGLILFKYILHLLNPFAPFLSQHLYNKLYSSYLLLSKRDNKLLSNLVNSLNKISLEKEKKYLIIRENSKIMGLLFYPLIQEIRNFKKKYLFEERIIIWLVLLPMSRLSEKDKESYLINEFRKEEIRVTLDVWLRKLVNVELNNIIWYNVKETNSVDYYEKQKKKLEAEKSVKIWEEELFLGPGRLEVFIPNILLPRMERTAKDIKERKIKEEIKFLEKEITRCNNLLANEGYLAKAPRELIEKEKEKLFKLQKRYKGFKTFK